MKIGNKVGRVSLAILGLAAVFLHSTVYADDNENIVAAVVSAPVVANGLVAGHPTEFNIMLNTSEKASDQALDAENFGQQIPAGGWMELELSGGFIRNKNAAGEPVVSPILANRNIILTTGPQSPIVAGAGAGVQHGNWMVMDDGVNLITIKPKGGNGDNGLEGKRAKKIGFKVIHLRPNSAAQPRQAVYVNGPAGSVGTITVRIYDKNGELEESGAADVMFHASVGRQVHFTNAGLTTGAQGSPNTVSAELVESTLFQHVMPNTELTTVEKHTPFSSGAPYAPRFLLFEDIADQDAFIPQAGIENVTYRVDSERPWVAMLKEADRVIGSIIMSGPTATDRGMILAPNAPTVLGGNGSLLTVPVKVGSAKGNYKVTVSLLNGGSATNTIVVDKK